MSNLDQPDSLQVEGDLVLDYEVCGTCGFDHYYDQSENLLIAQLHEGDDNA